MGYIAPMQNRPETVTLDVRPLLAQGIEPIGAIIQAKSQLNPGQHLVLRAPFEPIPLYALFQNEGYQVEVKKHAEDDWEIKFIPGLVGRAKEHEIDLRSLEPTAHLQKTLDGVQALGRDERLVLHSNSQPNKILEQLETETTDYDCEETGPDHWVTTIWRIAR